MTIDAHQPSEIVPLLPSNRAVKGSHEETGPGKAAIGGVIILLPLAWLWLRLIDNLRLEWSTNPEYAFGWVVPFLCAGLVLRARAKPEIAKAENRNWNQENHEGKAESRTENHEIGRQKVENGNQFQLSKFQLSVFPISAFCLVAFLYLPTRLIEAATPEWRPIQWSLGLEVIGLTLIAIYIGKGRGWLRQLAFPIAFFAVAIPWPTPIEQPIIQNLTRAAAAVVIELLGWAGVPAMAHGNVIEIATGLVGIDEACSGIRSFQTSLVISLFFGEFYGLTRARRWLLVPVGFALSMAFNVGRMFLLTLVAAKQGVSAIAQYHDPTGITIAVTCTLVLWNIAWMLSKRQKAEMLKPEILKNTNEKTENRKQKSESRGPISAFQHFSFSAFSRFALLLIVWLILVEGGVQLWYRHLEAHVRPGPAWSLNFPKDNATLKDVPIAADTQYLLRYDDGKQAEWTETDGTQWQAFYFNWLPGRVAGYLAKRHTPEVCLPAAGVKLRSGPELTMVNVHGVALPVRSYVFETAGGPIQVFHCRWEAGADQSAYVRHESERFNLIRGIWSGRGNQGQKVLEIIISGVTDPVLARAAFVRQLEKLIVLKKS